MSDKIIFELTLNEAKIVQKAIMSHSPAKDDEMLAVMLYARITTKINEAHGT
jgi:hypothetical protein